MKQNGKLFLTIILSVVLVFALSCLFACDNDTKGEKSVYEIYKEAHPEYEGDNEQFLRDLLDGKLGAAEEEKSLYEIYKEAHPEYEGTEQEWMEEILGLSIGTQPEYTVTFKLNETDEDPYMSVMVKKGETPYFPHDNPKKRGYEFLYWGYDGYEWPASYPITHDTVITAVWETNVYKVNYHLDGGTNDIFNPSEYTVEERATITSPVKEYYVFDGWYSSDAFSESEKVEEIALGSIGDLDLYAKWTPVQYAIIYESVEGATFEGDEVTSYNFETDNVRLPKAQKPYYKFLGWTTEESTTPNPDYLIKSGNHGNVIFKANWKAIEYTVTYDLDGGINHDENLAKYTVDDFKDVDSIVLSEPSKKQRESFKNSALNGITGMWTITSSVLTYTFDRWEDDNGNVVTEIKLGDGNISLIAKWKVTQSADSTRESPYLRDYDNDLVYIGLYPQRELSEETDSEILVELNKLVSDEAVKAVEDDKNGIKYVDTVYNNKKYRKAMYINHFNMNKCFAWFEFEPIPWDIVDVSESGVALLSCKTQVGVSGYDGNGYWAQSRARAYLNSLSYSFYDNGEDKVDDYAGIGIYDQLFNDAQKAIIQISSVDNTAKHEYEKYGGNNSEDKLFLFSLSEIAAYGSAKMGYYVNSYISRTKMRDIGAGTLNYAFTRSLLSDTFNSGEKRIILRRAAGDYILGYSGAAPDTSVMTIVPAMRIQLADVY